MAGTHGQNQVVNEELKQLRADLAARHAEGKLDGYGLYLLGVILKELDLREPALDMFLLSIQKCPLHWGAWQEMASLFRDAGDISKVETFISP